MVYNKATTKRKDECYEILRNVQLQRGERAPQRNRKRKEVPYIQKAFQNHEAQRFA